MRQLHLFVLALSVFAVGCKCGAKPPAPTQLLEGEACENDERCVTGLCDAAPGFSPVCVRRCGDGCQPTEVCVQLTPNRFACQPDQRKLCQPCAADLDCPYPSDKCLLVNTEKVCGRDCAFDQTCPTGYRCVNGAGADGTPKIQQCVPIVASCACLARGDFEQPCQTMNAEGTCSGLKKCDLVSNSVVCDAREAMTETCNGLDDDCDGVTDEGQMTATCGVGACQRSVDTCVDGGVANCTPGMPITELCNGIDDDCDGVLDNGFDTTTTVTNCGACGRVCMLPNATPRCDVGVCRVLTCNTGFDNCNNMDPDGCEANVTADPMNCGGCNQACTRPNSTATCMNSTCSFVCAAGWVDLNNDPTDGCEYSCTFTSATDLPDLMFRDANCDGIDGEVNNGIFVAPNGDDMNPGTKAAPVLTLAEAMNKQSLTSKRDVYLALGNYAGPLRILGAQGVGCRTRLREGRNSEGIDKSESGVIYAAHEPTPQAPDARNQHHAAQRRN
ncbi:MAG: MopE-related protein, partial [Archangium sp.]|nr:MopE-related protein [Archangium sp.]